jgi:TRAP-type C4-dicarboxylate transport system permease small subunit
MNRFLRISENLAALFLLLIALLVTLNVTLRYVLSIQIPDWFDLSRQLQAIAIFWGIAIATYRGSHICVDIVWEHLGRSGKRMLDLMATIVTLLFLIPMAWMIWVKVGSTGTQATSDLRLPLIYFYAVAAAGATVAVVLAAKRIWGLWQGQEDTAANAESAHGP